MKLRQFLTVMGVVALVALIYSPSTIGFSASPGGDGGTGPTDTSPSGTSMFLSYLRGSGYHVVVANTSQQVMAALTTTGQKKVAYLLIGPDTVLTDQVTQAVKTGYQSGMVSALIAEGNSTNIDLLQAFGVKVTGTPIIEPATTFQDARVFTVEMALGSNNATGVIDIASPVVITNSSSTLHPVATTSKSSYDLTNSTHGPRTVVAAGSSAKGARAIILTDSAPFTNFLSNYTQGKVDEQRFVGTMVSWVSPAKSNTTILLDASSYLGPKPPKFEVGLPIGPLVTYALEQNLAGLNTYYASFPSQISSYLSGLGVQISPGLASGLVALLLLLSVYGAITRWFAPEKRGVDDLPPPKVERTIVAESRARLDFLQTSRSKGSYVATLAQLYELLDSVVTSEFGKGISSIEEGDIATKVGEDEAGRAKTLFLSLARLHDYASGNKRFLFPPVLRWRALTARTTREAEAFLNLLGITLAGEVESDEKKRMEQLMRQRVRA